MKLYIIRHGQTESNRGNKLLGITDEGINECGYEQTLKAKENLSEIKFDVTFSSPLKRTLQTARILSNDEVPIIIDDRLKERGFGSLEGGSSNDKYTSDFWDYYINRDDYGVEPLKELFDRTKEFIDDLKQNYADKCVLVVSHAATIRALHYNIVGFDKNTDMLLFKVDNGHVLEYDLS